MGTSTSTLVGLVPVLWSSRKTVVFVQRSAITVRQVLYYPVGDFSCSVR